MRNNIFQSASNILAQWRKRRAWRKIVGVLSCVVVFCTTYALILPAITLEKSPACGVEEHTHMEDCYTQVTAVTKTVPICTLERLSIHRHGSECLDENDQLRCGEADFIVHVHNENCRDENGLWCPIPEKKAHTHDGSCYKIPETHAHGEDCYQKERGELICTESTEPAHTHGEGCYEISSVLTCTQVETEGHKHSESCYESVLICTESTEPAHVHTDECYAWTDVLTCTEPTDPAEPVLICEKEEVLLHRHTRDGCYKTDENGSPYLTCTQLQILEHVHTDACFQTVEEPVDTQALTCRLEESETHQHGPRCYGTWELTCGLEAHTHTESCYPQETTQTETASAASQDPEEGSSQAPEAPVDPEENADDSEEPNLPQDSQTSEDPTSPQGPQSSEEPNLPQDAQTSEEPNPPQDSQTSEEPNPPQGSQTSEEPNLPQDSQSSEEPNLLQDSQASEEPAANTTPLDLNKYISNAVLSYRVGDAAWQEVTSGTALPGNAELKLEISYEGIYETDLKPAGLQVTYTLPSILRAPTGSGQIRDSSNNNMGTMTVENSVVTVTFDETWLSTHHSASGNDTISGKFHVQSGIDLSQASQTPSMELTVGKVKIGLNFENDLIAKYADVKIQKSDPVAIHVDGADYLEYPLTVTAGQDGAPNVVVKDAFQDLTQIAGYVGISPETPATDSVTGPSETGTPADGQPGQLSMDGNTMVWTIGNMAANETRTLTYRVKLKDGYLGGKVPSNPVVNTANLFCGEHDRGDDTGTFTPQAEATMSKVAAQFTPDENGGGTIKYTIWIHAMDTNNYTLTNVKIWDALDGSIGNNNATDEKYLRYLSFDKDSFLLYPGGHIESTESGDIIVMESTEGTKVTPVSQPKPNTDGELNDHYIFCDVGTLAPGESKTLTYTVKVDPGVFPAAGNNTPKINNRAQIHAGDSDKGNETGLESYNESVNIAKKEWSSKQKGTKQTTENKVSIPDTDAVYAANGSQVAEHKDLSFPAPAGSYLYHVSVNKKGDWNVSGATLKDQLVGDFSTFIGYVKVEAYNVDASGNRTLDKTVWRALDTTSKEFSFKPTDIGLANEPQAYELTYYTSVTVPEGAPQVNVENTFTMSGSVGIGDYSYIMTGAYVTASNIVQGENHFSVSKHSWYYEPSKVPAKDPNTGEKNPYANGAIYWYIQVDGTEIPANTYLKDQTAYNNQFIYPSSLIGLYTGNLGGESIAAYDDLEDLLDSGKLTRLDEPGYSSKIEGIGERFPSMTVCLKNSVSLSAGESLYLIVKIEPHVNPAGEPATSNHTYQNGVQSSYDGSNWVSWGKNSQLVIYGANGISKTLEKISTWNGTTETVVTPEGGTADPDALTDLESGTYVSWKVQLNYTGRLHGSYYVEELIPDGMKLAYVQCTGVGAGYSAAAKPSCAQKSPGDGWTEHQRAGVIDTYYYTNEQTARWYVDGLQTGGTNHTIDFRVVCRVTDEDVLLGGTEKEFQNQVRLLREGGKVIDSSSSPVSIQTHSLSKEGIYNKEDPTQDSSKYPFVITLNPLGEDLVPGADTLSLVDTLSDTLRLDLSSIQVKETGTDTLVEGWTSAVNGQTLTLTLPDQKALTVTYSAWIEATPGDRISISNNAHWEGHPTPDSGAVKNDDFEFDISGSAGTEEEPSLHITKLDANDLSQALKGACFTLRACLETPNPDGTFPETGPTWNGNTNDTGNLDFGVDSSQTMNPNTIYCLRETSAPDGYVLDDTPYYFVIAQKVTGEDGTEAYPEFPANVHVHYRMKYSYQALNQKGQITVQKTFTDLGGNTCAPVVGTYTFGLYETADGSGDPVQTGTITYTAEDTTADKTVVFKDLLLDKSYYVFELDAGGKPISNGGFLYPLFLVSYDYPGDATCATLTTTNGDQTVTVTNQVCTPELPQTGGIGTAVFYAAGPILLVGAVILLLKRKRVHAEA